MRLVIGLFCVSVAVAGMSGTYTIKPDGSGDFRTMREAGSALADSGLSGDCTLEIYGDTLDCDVTLDQIAGSDSCTTTFRPGPGESPVLEGGVVEAYGTDNVKLERLHFTGSGCVVDGCQGFRISGCRLLDLEETGIVVQDGAFDTVIGNELVMTGTGWCIFAEGGHDVAVANNFISGSTTAELVLLNVVEGAGLYHNTVRYSPAEPEFGTALLFEGVSGGQVDCRNNLVILAPPADSYHACVGYSAATPVRFSADNDCYYMEVLGYVGYADTFLGGTYLDWPAWQGRGFDPNGLNADPLIVGPNDLHLREGSPCVGAGVPIAGIATDIDGDPRDPVHPDIGADEFVPGGAAEGQRPVLLPAVPPRFVRGSLFLPAFPFHRSSFVLLNSAGRRVTDLRPGANDVRHVPAGVYFVRVEVPSGQGAAGSAWKVLILD